MSDYLEDCIKDCPALAEIIDQMSLSSCFSFVACAMTLYSQWKSVNVIPTETLSALEVVTYIDEMYPIPPWMKNNYGDQYGYGSSIGNALEYIRVHGVCPESEKPYKDVLTRLPFPLPQTKKRYYIRGFKPVYLRPGPRAVYSGLRRTLRKKSLLSLYLYAVPSFTNYKSGIYQGFTDEEAKWLGSDYRNRENCAHYVLICGWGKEKGNFFYWVKNTAGLNWGIKGYMKISPKVVARCQVYKCWGGYCKENKKRKKSPSSGQSKKKRKTTP